MKYISYILLLSVIVSSLTSCSQIYSPSEDQNSNAIFPLGTYVLQRSKDSTVIFLPSVELKEDGSFTFSFSPLLSTIPSGTYEISNGQLILSTEFQGNPTSTYIFSIDEGDLIFDSVNSDALIPELWTDEITNGTPFILLSEIPATTYEE